MRAGDQLDISIHDSPAGLVTRINDLSSGQSGSMTASVANGFAQVNYDPNAATCSQTPYAFHPMYSDLQRTHPGPVGGPLLQHRLLRRDRPLRVLQQRHRRRDLRRECQRPGRARRRRRRLLRPPGLLADPDRRLHRHRQRLRRRVLPAQLAGHADRPAAGPAPTPQVGAVHQPHLQRRAQLQPGRVRGRPAPHRGGRLRRQLRPQHRSQLREPATGSQLLPDLHHPQQPRRRLLLAARRDPHPRDRPGPFGGTSTAEFGPLLFLDYPGPGFTPIHRTNDFRRVLPNNPCRRS